MTPPYGGALPSLQGLTGKRLREQALAALRTAITSGELPPGRQLIETELSEILQISRGTLREALRPLEQEGLITAGPRGHLSVRHIDATAVRDIYTVRAALESLAVRTLCELPDRDTAVKLLHRAVDAIDAAREASVELWLEADTEFHRSLCQLAGNKTLLHSWTSLEGSRRLSVVFGTLEMGSARMSPKRYRDIVIGIETGDASLSIKAINEHMNDVAKSLVA
ncbi:GntR family transcriptional regulator [Arthrobacter sp. R4]|uniref:GntR family transcriptional regulator n=1 Tax=Arthrobacter sp. R4 TaxID=644417 RepID=UPI003ED84F32